MPTKLNQIIAVEKGAKADAQRALTDAYHTLQKPALLSGISRVYKPRDEEGDALPSESTRVQVTVEQVLNDATTSLVRMFDVVAAKDWANCTARADVIVDQVTIVHDAPVTYLLFVEKQLTDLHTLISKLPVLDPAEKWEQDPAVGVGVWRTGETSTTRTRKTPRNHVKAEATEHHPAQVEVYMEDVIVGTWATTRFSGALPAARVAELAGRVRKLADAVKRAREEANSTPVENQDVGAAVFGYLLG